TGHLRRAHTTLSLDSLSAEIRSTRTLNQFDIGSKVNLDLCLTHPVFWGTLCPRGCSSGPPPQRSALRLGSLSYCWSAESHLWGDGDRQFGAGYSLRGWSLRNGLGGGSHGRRWPAVSDALPSSPCRCCDRRGAWCHPRADPAASSIQARGGVSTP